MSMISLLHSTKINTPLRWSVNNNDILRVQWDITGLYPSALISINYWLNFVIDTLFQKIGEKNFIGFTQALKSC